MNQSEPVLEYGSTREIITAVWIGAVVGLSTWILTYILSQYVIGSIACRVGSSLVHCGDAVAVSAGIAVILASIIGTVLLVRERTFRPLLVALASLATLWGMTSTWLQGASFLTFFSTMIIGAAVYTVFVWFSRIRNFWLSLGIIVVLVLLFRLLVTL